MRSLLLLLATGLVLASAMLAHAANGLERTVTGDDVTVTLTSPLAQLPPGGCVPFRVTIRNDTGAPGSWHLSFNSSANYSNRQNSVYEQDVSVAAHSSGSFDLLVPLPSLANGNTNYNNLTVRINGPGINNENRGGFVSYYNNSSNTRSPFALIGNEVVGKIGLGPIENLYKDKNQEFYGGSVECKDLPTDWRAYSGVSVVLLRDAEWLDLSPAQRDALCDYIAQGGHLTLFYPSTVGNEAPPDLHFSSTDAQNNYGFGSVSLIPLSSDLPSAEMLKGAIGAGAASAQEIDMHFSIWDLRKSLGIISVSSFFILSFVILFGTLVGPVNLFYFARGNHRFRLFWTTPLISLVASIILICSILFTDGIGGAGKQMIAIFSLPGQNREAIIQEQISRTAVLFSNQWRNEQNYLITPISATSIRNAMDHDETYSSRHNRSGFNESPDNFYQQGNILSGTWFRSRSISGQYLQAMVPTRSALTITNPDAVKMGDAPVVLSSFPKELTDLFLIDEQGHYWKCSSLEPGRKKTCTPGTTDAFAQFWKEATALAGGKLLPALENAAYRRGYFYATGMPADTERLATLNGIAWQVTSGIYLGPWVAAPTPENGP